MASKEVKAADKTYEVVNMERAEDTAVDPNPEDTVLRWENVNVYVKLPKPSVVTRIRKPNEKFPSKKQVLFNVSGKIESGTMLAIMGASGSGKTTLLNGLAGFTSKRIKLIGDVLVNEKTVDMPSVSAYVHQFDLFIPTLTVQEHLHFYASLVLDKTSSKQQIIERVDELIHEFGLDSCRKSLIGTPVGRRGISGGESRRLTIATQVISKKKIIFLDEPTSGLDSFSAESVIHIIQKMALNNCIIVCTIHQPSSTLFNVFDQLLLLSEGKVVFNGPRSDALASFSAAGFTCPNNYNPADFFIETIAIKSGSEETSREAVKKIIATKNNGKEIDPTDDSAQNHQAQNHQATKHKTKKGSCKTSLTTQMLQLSKRSWLTNYREPMLFKARLFQTIVIGLIYGLIYLQLANTEENIQNFAGALFGLLAQSTFGSVLGVLHTFPEELNVFRRDHMSKLYGTSMYFLAKTMAEIPTFVLFPIILASITYYMIGFNPAATAFFIHTGILILVSLCGVGYGYFISSLSKDFAMASSLSTPLLIPLMIFGGFFIRAENIPIYFQWISYISWFKYGFESLAVNQFTGLTLACGNTTSSSCPPDATSIPGTAAIARLGLTGVDIYVDALAILGLIVGFRLLAWIILLIRTYFDER